MNVGIVRDTPAGRRTLQAHQHQQWLRRHEHRLTRSGVILGMIFGYIAGLLFETFLHTQFGYDSEVRFIFTPLLGIIGGMILGLLIAILMVLLRNLRMKRVRHQNQNEIHLSRLHSDLHPRLFALIHQLSKLSDSRARQIEHELAQAVISFNVHRDGQDGEYKTLDSALNDLKTRCYKVQQDINAERDLTLDQEIRKNVLQWTEVR